MAIADATEELKVKLLHREAQPPTRVHEGDAGFDLHTLEAFVLQPGERRLVSTGVAIALPDGFAGMIVPRSGLAVRHGVTTLNAPGLVDANYRGEVKVVLHNAGQKPYEAQPGDRIAQLLLVPYWAPTVRTVDELPATKDDRGSNGFGSSGR